MPFLLVLVMAFGVVFSAPPSEITPALAREKMDSLRRSLDAKIFTPQEQKFWRECMKEKQKFLTAERKADRNFAEVDTLLRQAKISHRDPDDPDIARLLEKKFLLENGLEQRWLASARGKSCGDMESKRRNMLDATLEKDPDYRKWKKISESPAESKPEPI
jgi:hypothetical protein